jgi:hypothetical protein
MVSASLTWLFFGIASLGIAGIGLIVLVLALFFGGQQSFGLWLYAIGAIGTTGAYGLIGYTAADRPIRLTARSLVGVTALLWLFGLPSFMHNPGF